MEMEQMMSLIVYGFAGVGLFVTIASFRKKPEPVDGLTYLPRISRALDVAMELKLEYGVITLWIYKPNAEPMTIVLSDFDSRVRRLVNMDKIEAIAFVREVTGYSLKESKDYVDKFVK